MVRRPAVSMMQTSRPEAPGLLDAGDRGRHRVAGLAEHGHLGRGAEHSELLDGGGPLEVRPDQERVAALAPPPLGELGRRRGLARALEAGQQHHRRGPGGVGEAEGLAA